MQTIPAAYPCLSSAKRHRHRVNRARAPQLSHSSYNEHVATFADTLSGRNTTHSALGHQSRALHLRTQFKLLKRVRLRQYSAMELTSSSELELVDGKLLSRACLGACSGGSRLDVVAPAAKITRYSAWCLEEGSAGHKYMARPTGWARREPNQHTDVCGKRRLSRYKQCFKCLTNTRNTRATHRPASSQWPHHQKVEVWDSGHIIVLSCVH